MDRWFRKIKRRLHDLAEQALISFIFTQGEHFFRLRVMILRGTARSGGPMMNTAVPAVAIAACRGICFAAGGVSFAASAPVVGIALGIAALTAVGISTITWPNSSIRLSYGDLEAEFRRGSS
jgi:hypothetical protein